VGDGPQQPTLNPVEFWSSCATCTSGTVNEHEHLIRGIVTSFLRETYDHHQHLSGR
jgi:hypothetical protein